MIQLQYLEDGSSWLGPRAQCVCGGRPKRPCLQRRIKNQGMSCVVRLNDQKAGLASLAGCMQWTQYVLDFYLA